LLTETDVNGHAVEHLPCNSWWRPWNFHKCSDNI